MKTLLLFFTLLSFTCYGQDTLPFGKGYENTEMRDYPNINPRDTVPYELLSRSDETFIIVEKLIQYAEWCYNDSTVKYKHFTIKRAINFSGAGMGNDSQIGMMAQNGIPGHTYNETCTRKKHPSHYTRIITHRKPTFEGFIEWLRKH